MGGLDSAAVPQLLYTNAMWVVASSEKLQLSPSIHSTTTLSGLIPAKDIKCVKNSSPICLSLLPPSSNALVFNMMSLFHGLHSHEGDCVVLLM